MTNFEKSFKTKFVSGEQKTNLFTPIIFLLLKIYLMITQVVLIYIDPPFATNGHFKISNNRANTISSSNEDAIAYSDTLVEADFLEFLRELLPERGSIYLHIDYGIAHYVKLIVDEVFGRGMFRNDIIRIKCNPRKI